VQPGLAIRRRGTTAIAQNNKLVPQQSAAIKILSENRSAGHNYHLLDRYEAGMVLMGTEVKAAKIGKIQLKEAYAEVSDGEAWLLNAHISEYSHGNIMNHPPVRKRKLLLHKSEINRLLSETREKGLTLIPTKLYLKAGRIKIEIAVAKGKKFHDKREAERAREMQAEARAEMGRRSRTIRS
jgi:SsrA-binding protein